MTRHKNLFDQRTGGLLLPLSALPSAFGVGDAGPAARRFVDFLCAAGLSWWQMLPMGPLGAGNSPYDSSSAFAGDPLYISLETLARDGWLTPSQCRSIPSFPRGQADYARVRPYREPLLRLAYQRFQARCTGKTESAYNAFCRRERFWLQDYCLFTALARRYGTSAWTTWEPDLRRRRLPALKRAARECRDEIGYQQFLQYQWDAQWRSLRRYAAGRGVRLIGDVAIFVSQESADVWAHQDLFKLNETGRPAVVAGVPPDYFSKDGQRWGNPLYRWDRLARKDYAWWVMRLRQALSRFDAIRLDHFIGFHRAWEIPASSPTAQEGRYQAGPGADFFRTVQRKLGPLPFIAEDLGVVTPEVKALRDEFHFPGMKVLQFAFGTDPEALNYQPHRYEQNCVAYTGTHDNDTLAGWWNDRGSASSTRTPADIRREREVTRQYLGGQTLPVPWPMIGLLWASVARTAIVPVQDILGLGSGARMNRPGTITDNWAWRLKPGQLTRRLTQRLRDLSIRYERLNVSETSVK